MSDITIKASEALVALKAGDYTSVESLLNKIIELDKPKKRGRKSKLDLTLEKLGYTRAQMQKFWDDALEVNWKIQAIEKCGKDWKDLNEYQLADLVNLKEKTLKQLAEQKAKEKAKAEAEESARKIREYYQEHFEEIVCDKILSGVALEQKEFDSLVFEYNIAELNAGEVYKNYQSITTISALNDHYFKICWRMDLSGWGEHQFDNAPVEVKKTSKITGYDLDMKPIEVTVWEEV